MTILRKMARAAYNEWIAGLGELEPKFEDLPPEFVDRLERSQLKALKAIGISVQEDFHPIRGSRNIALAILFAGVALLLLPTSALAVDTRVLDQCEDTLRACHRKCMRANTAYTCKFVCTTAFCDGIGGREQSLAEFLWWRKYKGRIPV